MLLRICYLLLSSCLLLILLFVVESCIGMGKYDLWFSSLLLSGLCHQELLYAIFACQELFEGRILLSGIQFVRLMFRFFDGANSGASLGRFMYGLAGLVLK